MRKRQEDTNQVHMLVHLQINAIVHSLSLSVFLFLYCVSSNDFDSP